MAFTSCILFTSETSEQNTTSKGHLALKKATISREYDVHCFEGQTSLTNFLMNVEHKCLIFSIRIWVYYDLPVLPSIFQPRRPSLSTFLTSNWSNILNLPPYLCVKKFAWFACLYFPMCSALSLKNNCSTLLLDCLLLLLLMLVGVFGNILTIQTCYYK